MRICIESSTDDYLISPQSNCQMGNDTQYVSDISAKVLCVHLHKDGYA